VSGSRSIAPARDDRPFRAALFDLFGTLIPTGSLATRTENLRAVAELLGAGPAESSDRWLATFDDRVRGRLGDLTATLSRLARETGGRPSPTTLESAASLRMEYVRSLFAAGEPSLRPLDGLRERRMRLGLVSDTSDDTVRLWPSTAFARRFDVAVFSCVEGVRKPDPRIFHVAVERLGLEPAECAFVGDGGSRELSGAEAAGLTAFQYVFPEDEESAYRLDPDVGWTGPRLLRIDDLPARCGRGRT
jgi:putative hydrolase of the HAD superfamily